MTMIIMAVLTHLSMLSRRGGGGGIGGKWAFDPF